MIYGKGFISRIFARSFSSAGINYHLRYTDELHRDGTREIIHSNHDGARAYDVRED